MSLTPEQRVDRAARTYDLSKYTPEQLAERARRAARARTEPDALIRSLVRQAPSLTDEQRDQLRAILAPAVVREEDALTAESATTQATHEMRNDDTARG